MRANFALKSGRDEWTRTTDPHLIRKSLFKVWVEHLLPFAPYLQ